MDTGAALPLISKTTRKAVLPRAELLPTVRAYTGEAIQIVGEVLVDVQYCQQEVKQLPLIVAEGEGPPLLGRN